MPKSKQQQNAKLARDIAAAVQSRTLRASAVPCPSCIRRIANSVTEEGEAKPRSGNLSRHDMAVGGRVGRCVQLPEHVVGTACTWCRYQNNSGCSTKPLPAHLIQPARALEAAYHAAWNAGFAHTERQVALREALRPFYFEGELIAAVDDRRAKKDDSAGSAPTETAQPAIALGPDAATFDFAPPPPPGATPAGVNNHWESGVAPNTGLAPPGFPGEYQGRLQYPPPEPQIGAPENLSVLNAAALGFAPAAPGFAPAVPSQHQGQQQQHQPVQPWSPNEWVVDVPISINHAEAAAAAARVGLALPPVPTPWDYWQMEQLLSQGRGVVVLPAPVTFADEDEEEDEMVGGLLTAYIHTSTFPLPAHLAQPTKELEATHNAAYISRFANKERFALKEAVKPFRSTMPKPTKKMPKPIKDLDGRRAVSKKGDSGSTPTETPQQPAVAPGPDAATFIFTPPPTLGAAPVGMNNHWESGVAPNTGFVLPGFPGQHQGQLQYYSPPEPEVGVPENFSVLNAVAAPGFTHGPTPAAGSLAPAVSDQHQEPQQQQNLPVQPEPAAGIFGSEPYHPTVPWLPKGWEPPVPITITHAEAVATARHIGFQMPPVPTAWHYWQMQQTRAQGCGVVVVPGLMGGL
ncbi:hypothetical protein B0T25DRAFT_630050 [Lasiosphaeria hispida]|uniref:Uncharacterized protein n=1 Tax=Lasiosphaeria hispida TaxID=260671 RepID=A0AAJ0HL01_9PEZI|nr:hypothetical protein B0T25DRAFT_630050 [Lasiosphaeria hispida]